MALNRKKVEDIIDTKAGTLKSDRPDRQAAAAAPAATPSTTQVLPRSLYGLGGSVIRNDILDGNFPAKKSSPVMPTYPLPNANQTIAQAAAPVMQQAAAAMTPEEAADRAQQAMQKTLGSGLYPTDAQTGQPVTNFGAAVDTGFTTTDGDRVTSSYGNASDFYNQIAINNILDQTPSGAMTYEAYLAYNGITDPRLDYYRNLDAANEMYARAIGTYGASGEGLAQGNLANAGYSEYLTGLAYANRAQMYGQAAAQMRADNQTYGLRYAQYRQDYDEQQQLLAEQRAAYQAMQQAAAAQEAEAVNPSGSGSTGVNIDITGSGSGTQSGGESTPSASPTLTTDAQKTAADYLNSNVKTASQLNSAVVAMRGQGYSDADIQAAIDSWYAQKEADINGSIDSLSYLAAGSADELKQIYGEGDHFEAALNKLQAQNDKLVKAVIKEITGGNVGSDRFENILAAVRESTLTTDKKGNQSYSWDSMSAGDKAVAARDYFKQLYNSGDISKTTYNNAMYEYFNHKIKNEVEKHSTDANWFGSRPKAQIEAIAEQLAKINEDKDMMTEGQYNLIRETVKQLIKVEKNEANSLTLSVNGKKKTFDYEAYPAGDFLSSPGSNKALYSNGKSMKGYSGYYQSDYVNPDGSRAWVYTDGKSYNKADPVEPAWLISNAYGLTREQTYSLLDVLFG